MTESQILQSVAEGGGTTVGGVVAFVLWRCMQALQRIAQTSSDTYNHQRTIAQRAERHYETEEELYRSLQEQHAVARSTSDHRATTERELIRLRARLETLENNAATTRATSGPIRISD